MNLLGNMNNSGRVGDITSSTSVTSGNSGDGGVSKTDGGQRGGRADLGVASGNRGGNSDSGGSDSVGGNSGSGNSVGGNGWGSVVRVSQSVVVGVGSVGVGVASVARVGVVTGIGESVTVGGVEQSGVSLGISLGLGLSLGNMDNPGRVGDVLKS